MTRAIAVLAAAAALLAVPAAAPAGDVVRYHHQRADVAVAARTWTPLGAVPAIGGRAGTYSWQAALDSPHRGRCNVRFMRQPAHDGTGDQTFLHPGGRWWITHAHTVAGFPGTMQVRLWCTERTVVRWRILKGIS